MKETPHCGFTLRPAVEEDAGAIKALVYEAHLNPIGLNWQRFVVAIAPGGEVIGCGQVKVHRDGSRELASLVVASGWRGKGVAKAIIENLTAAHPGELFLTCRSGLGAFYERFGFRVLQQEDMPPFFRRFNRLAQALKALYLKGDNLLVMRRAPTSPAG